MIEKNWTSCCRGRKSNCPQVKVEDGFVYIRDDRGGEVKLTIPEYQMVFDLISPKVAEELVRSYELRGLHP